MELHEEIGAVRRETELDAPREDVWALVSEPEGLATWLADEVALDAVEPGARGTVTEHGEERHVTIEDVEPGRRVSLSWCAPGGEPSLVELTLDDIEEDAAGDPAAIDFASDDAVGDPAAIDFASDDAVGNPDAIDFAPTSAPRRRTRMVVVEIPLVTLRVVSAPVFGGSAARGPQMAAV
jgi:uncharacterized protein YndB with AHSA1/START domain